ncbi:MAG: TetR family transcriptional regulator [Deltaproteobacteria bacterium]|nr:TetR family transcriptional regulator [Deltaproteobacteria bacterium]
MAPESTRERILDTAEELFAAHGIQGTSLRALTRRAEVNLAAVHYYFGSKDGLLDAVVGRRAEALNAERSQDLERLIGEASADGPRAEAILEAYFRPVIAYMCEQEARGRQATVARLLARIEAEPPDVLGALIRRHFGELSARYLEALQAALPHLPPEQVAERFRFAAALLTQLLSGNLELDVIPGHPPHEASVTERAQHAIAFILAGLRSPAIATIALQDDPCKRADAGTDNPALDRLAKRAISQ